MKIKIKEDHWLPHLFMVAGITIYPYIFLADKKEDVLVNHEMIHIEQFKECGWFSFVWCYFRYYFKYYLECKELDEAYYQIPFEREAYDNADNLNYLKERKPFAWKKYVEKVG